MIAMNLLKFKNISDDYDRAFQLVSYLFHDKKDKAGIPYINHLVSVSNMLDTRTTKIAGLLHDVLEDTNVTEDELRNMFPNEIVDGVIALTHRKDESYFEYISRVSTSKLAKKVKIADLLHNLDITRIKEPTKQDYLRLEKYKEAILYLATH